MKKAPPVFSILHSHSAFRSDEGGGDAHGCRPERNEDVRHRNLERRMRMQNEESSACFLDSAFAFCVLNFCGRMRNFRMSGVLITPPMAPHSPRARAAAAAAPIGQTTDTRPASCTASTAGSP